MYILLCGRLYCSVSACVVCCVHTQLYVVHTRLCSTHTAVWYTHGCVSRYPCRHLSYVFVSSRVRVSCTLYRLYTVQAVHWARCQKRQSRCMRLCECVYTCVRVLSVSSRTQQGQYVLLRPQVVVCVRWLPYMHEPTKQ